MQGLVWGEPELAHEYDFDVKYIFMAMKESFKYATWRNATLVFVPLSL